MKVVARKNRSRRTEDVELLDHCSFCKSHRHKILYDRLEDRHFGAEGSWRFVECVSCGIVFLNPRPSEERIHVAYTERYATRKRIPGVSSQPSIARQLIRNLKKAYLACSLGYPSGGFPLERALGVVPLLVPFWPQRINDQVLGLRYVQNGQLLDVGCGVGAFIAYMKSAGWSVTGVDLDPKVIETCRAQGLEARRGRLEDLKFPDNHFDAVTLKHVIEHVYHPRETLQEIHRILKLGGKVVLQTPNLQSLGHRYFKEYWLGLDPPRHLFLFNIRTLGSLVESVGFKVSSASSNSRISRFNFLVASTLKKNGQSAYFTNPTFWARIKSMAFFLMINRLLLFDTTVGDELIVVGEKVDGN